MCIEIEDVALPVEPCVGMQVLAVPQQLESHLGVLREIGLRIEQRGNEAMVLTAIYIPKDYRKMAEPCLCPKPWQEMCARLVLVALPCPYVVAFKLAYEPAVYRVPANS